MSSRAPDDGVRGPTPDAHPSSPPASHRAPAVPTTAVAPATPGAHPPGVGISAPRGDGPAPPWREFTSRRDGMLHAMDGGLWLHRHVWKGTKMAHLVSTDRVALLAYGHAHGLAPERLQYKPLKDPRPGLRRPAWPWDLVGRWLPPE